MDAINEGIALPVEFAAVFVASGATPVRSTADVAIMGNATPRTNVSVIKAGASLAPPAVSGTVTPWTPWDVLVQVKMPAALLASMAHVWVVAVTAGLGTMVLIAPP